MLKGIWNILPAIIGTLQLALPILKEIMVLIVRLIAVLPFLWSEGEEIILKINKVYDVVYDGVEKLKNFLLMMK